MSDMKKLLESIDSMSKAEKKSTGPEFPGYWKGKDPASKAKTKMVGSAEESVIKDLTNALKESTVERKLKEEFDSFQEVDEGFSDMMAKERKKRLAAAEKKKQERRANTGDPAPQHYRDELAQAAKKYKKGVAEMDGNSSGRDGSNRKRIGSYGNRDRDITGPDVHLGSDSMIASKDMQDRALDKLTKMLNEPDSMAVLKRLQTKEGVAEGRKEDEEQYRQQSDQAWDKVYSQAKGPVSRFATKVAAKLDGSKRKLGQNKEQGVAEGEQTTYRATVEYGPTAADAHFVTVKASSTEEAERKVAAWCKKKGVRNPMITINGADKPVDEGANDTVYPGAEVIKSKNGKPVGEIYQDASGWGCLHYKSDYGADSISSREEAIDWLKDLHDEYRQDRRLREASVAEAFIAPALSAANANAEFERTKTFVPRGYKGRVDLEVSSQDEYNMVMKALKRAAKYSEQHVECGLSGDKMSVFSKTMDSGLLDEFIDDVLEQGLSEGEGGVDTVTMDVPLMIRMLEYAREDAQTDMDLHDVAERMIKLGQSGRTLTMQDYDKICINQEEEGVVEAAKGFPHRVRYSYDDPSGSGTASGHYTVNAPDKSSAARYTVSDLTKKGKKNVKVHAVTPQKQEVAEEQEAKYGDKYQAMVQRVGEKAKKKPVDIQALAAKLKAADEKLRQLKEVNTVTPTAPTTQGGAAPTSDPQKAAVTTAQKNLSKLKTVDPALNPNLANQALQTMATNPNAPVSGAQLAQTKNLADLVGDALADPQKGSQIATMLQQVQQAKK